MQETCPSHIKVGNSYRPPALSSLHVEWQSFGLLQRVS